jgi:hypothetical protein
LDDRYVDITLEANKSDECGDFLDEELSADAPKLKKLKKKATVDDSELSDQIDSQSDKEITRAWLHTY